jgi:hypothetical protein
MHGLKSAIWAIFQKSADSAALQNSLWDCFLSFLFYFFIYFSNFKPLSEVAPGLVVIQI